MKKIISVASQTFLKPFIIGIIPFSFGALILTGIGLGFNGAKQSKTEEIFSYIGFILSAIIPLFLALFGSVNCYNLLKRLHYSGFAGLASLLITLLILFMFILLLPIVSWILLTILILTLQIIPYLIRGHF